MYSNVLSAADISVLPKYGYFSVIFVGDGAQLPPVDPFQGYRGSLLCGDVPKKAHADDGKDAFDAFLRGSKVEALGASGASLQTVAAVVKFKRLYRSAEL